MYNSCDVLRVHPDQVEGASPHYISLSRSLARVSRDRTRGGCYRTTGNQYEAWSGAEY